MKTILSSRDGEAVPDTPARLAFPAMLLACALLPGKAWAEARPGFDATTLHQRGIDPQLANLLLDAPRFAAGRQAVSLRVNGQPRGRLEVGFDQQGVLCFDRSLLDAANLTIPGDEGPCHDFLAQYPQSLVEPDPASLSVPLVVPTDALRPVQQDVSGYETGGVAGLLNYDLTGFYNRFGDGNSRFGSANTEVGFNAGDWIVRSRQVQTWQDGLSRSTHLEAYAQRTFASHQAVLQAGQISLYNPVLSGAQITGVQVLTEQALLEQGQSATIDGIANSPAQVEVRQNGALIHSTVVPAGPFSLTDVRRLNSRSDVEVTVKESSGGERRFTVPAAMLGLGLPAPGYSVAVGRVRNIGDAQGDDPWVASAGWTGAVHSQLSLGSGVLVSSEYRAAGLSLGWLPWLDSQIQLSTQLADTQARDKVRGLQTDLSWAQRLNDQWSFSVANSWRTPGYRELEEATYAPDTTQQPRSRYRDQQSATLGWSHPWLGAFSAGVSRSSSADGESSSRGLASWGTSVGGVSLSASAEWQMGGRQQQDNAVYLNVSLPLGESRRVRAWVRNSGGEHRTGLGLNEQIDDQLSYRVSAEHDTRDQQVETTLGLSALPRYSQLDFSYSRADAERSSYQGSARGGGRGTAWWRCHVVAVCGARHLCRGGAGRHGRYQAEHAQRPGVDRLARPGRGAPGERLWPQPGGSADPLAAAQCRYQQWPDYDLGRARRRATGRIRRDLDPSSVAHRAHRAGGVAAPWRLCQYRQRRVRDPGAGRWPGVPAQRAGAVRIVGQRTRDGALPAAV